MTGTNSAITTEELLAQTDWIRRLARGLMADPAAAEDVAQRALLVALERRPRQPGRLRAWLAGLVRNVARHERRAAERRRRHETAEPSIASSPSTASLVERAELQQRLITVVLALPEPYRTTVLLRYVEDFGAEEIGRRTGVPGSTVRTRLARGLARLREQLDSESCGGRESWLPALVALAGSQRPVTLLAPAAGQLTTWGTLMTIQGKLAVGAAVVLGLALALWSVFEVGGSPWQPTGQLDAPVVASDQLPPVPERSLPRPPTASPPEPEVLPISEAHPGQLVRVSGRLVDALGAPVADATLRLLPDGWTLAALGFDQSGDPLALGWLDDARVDDRHRPFDSPPWNLVAPRRSAADGTFVLSARLVLWDHSDSMSSFHRYPELVVQHAQFATMRVPCWERVTEAGTSLFEVGTLVLAPGVSIMGRVVDEHGAPLSGVDVRALLRGKLSPDERLVRVGQDDWDNVTDHDTLSGPDGRFLIPGLWAGEYELSLELGGVRPLVQPLELSAGAGPDASLRDLGDLVLADGEVLAGTVVDAQGRSIAGSEVRVSVYTDEDWRREWKRAFRERMERGEELHSIHLELEHVRRGAHPGHWSTAGRWEARHGVAVSGPDGSFRILGLSQGMVDVYAAAPGFEPVRQRQVLTGRTDLRVELPSQGSLRVRCVDAQTGQAIASVELEASREDEGQIASDLESLPVVPVSRTAQGEVPSPGGPGGDAGEQLVVEHVCAADVLLVVTAPGYPRQSLHVAGLPAGLAWAERTAMLLPAGGVIVGRVRDEDGRPIAGAQGSVYPGNPEPQEERRLERAFTTDAEGAFSTELLSAGSWNVSVWSTGCLPATARAALGSGNDRAEVELVLVRGATLSGRVLDDAARPVRGAGLRLERKTEQAAQDPAVKPWAFVSQTSFAGTFVFDRLAPGSYLVQAEDVGTLEVVLATGERREIEIRAGQSPVVHGLVTVDGQPVAGVAVVAEYANPEPDKRYSGLTYEERTLTAVDGSYELSITRRAPFELFVRSDEYPDVSRQALGPLSAPRTRVDLELPSGCVPVLVLSAESGLPVADARVQAWAGVIGGGRPIEGRTDDSGRCTLRHVLPGTRYLAVYHPEHLPLRQQPVLVPETGDATEQRIELARGGGVAGFVYAADGSLCPESQLRLATFRLDDVDGAAQPYGWTVTELVEGRYAVANLESGRWLLLFFGEDAWFEHWELDDLQPSALGRLELDVIAGVVVAEDLHLQAPGN